MNAETVQAISGFLINNLQREHATTKKLLGCVPDAQRSFKPNEKSMTAGELAWHIATAEVWFMTGVAEAKFDMSAEQRLPPPATTAEIVAWYEENFPRAVARVQALSADDLGKPVDFFGMMNLPGFAYLLLAANHSIHHRGQLSTYLRAMGEKVPSIYGPSADEPIEVLMAQAGK